MFTHKTRISSFVLIVLVAALLSACSTSTPVPATFTPEPPTATSVPPSPTFTETPLPTATETPLPTATFTPTPLPTDTATPLPTDTPTATATNTPIPVATLPVSSSGWAFSGDDIMMYFINLNTGGPVSCGDSLIAIRTGAKRSGDVAQDVATAVARLLGNRSNYVLGFYNPLSFSNISFDSATYNPDSGLITVNLSGTYIPTGDDCDNTRVKAQLWQTIRQFRDVKKTNIYLNGGPFGDKVSNDK